MGKKRRGDSKDKKLERLLESMQTLFGSLHDDQGVCACSISIVPDQLRKSNENAYMPKVVSIGPRYRGTRRDLQYMEEIKWHCTLSLLCRTDDAKESLKKCGEVILNFDEVVRASYVGDLKLDSYELARTMLYDGCFLLELLITGSDELNDTLKSRLYPPGPGAKVGKMEEVLSDLTVFENQIPLFILHMLSTLLFPDVFTEFGARVPIIHHLALSLLGYSPDLSLKSTLKVAHFLELVHSSITVEKIQESQHSSTIDIKSSEEVSSNTVDKIQESQHSSTIDHIHNHHIKREQVHNHKKSHVELKLKRCATRLQAAGVTIKPPDRKQSGKPLSGPAGDNNFVNNHPDNRVTKFNFDIVFNKGKLEIPPLHITETTEDVWRNFVAWEQHKKNWKSSSIAAGDLGTTGLSCKSTSSALFFNGLICCADDVQLLKDRKVIVVDHLNMSNEDILHFFRKITSGLDHGIIDSSYSKMIPDLNTYRAANSNTRIPILVWHYCRRIPEWLYRFYKFLKHDYNFAAAVILVLTVVQTCYTVLSYHHPK